MRRRDIIAGLTATAACPGSILAQSQSTPRGRPPFIVGVLAVGGPDSHSGNIVPSALAALGWVDGRNIRLLVREGNGDIESLTPLIDELVGLPADVVVARGGAVVAKLLERRGAPPVVMSATSLDPVRAGWARSYAKPDGNVTGLTLANDEAINKQLQLLKHASPGVTHVGLLKTRGYTTTDEFASTGLEAARAMGLRASIGLVAGVMEVEPEIDRLRTEGADALLVLADPVMDNFRRQVAEVAIQRRLPSAGQLTVYASAGFLITYAADLNAIHRRAAVYVDRILRGDRPGDLPIERPSKFVLTLNLNTARRMELIIPPGLLSLVDEVIE